jgi:CxxC-x17-CxxC domain-containing protein
MSYEGDDRGSGGYGGGRGRGGGRGGYGRGGGGGGYSSGPREMHDAVCSSCGQQCQVPFKPAEGRPVYCRECYAKNKPPRSNDY